MAKLTVTVEYDDVTFKAQPKANQSALNLSVANPSIALKTQANAQAILNVADTVTITTNDDTNTDYLAYYLLSKG